MDYNLELETRNGGYEIILDCPYTDNQDKWQKVIDKLEEVCQLLNIKLTVIYS